MPELIAQYQTGAYTEPFNGQSPMDAAKVLSNDNTTRAAVNSHDADPGIHLQSSTLALRPVASSAGRKWLTTDGLRLYYDTGSAWSEIAYLTTSGGTLTGSLLFSADATHDIGASGATRPRDVFLSRNLTVGGLLQMGTTQQAGAAFGDMILANLRSLRSVNTGGGTTKVLIKLNAADRVEISEDNTSVLFPMTTGGAVLFGTTVTTNAGVAEAVFPNAKGLRGVNAAGNDTHPLVFLDSLDMVCLGGNTTAVNSGRPVRVQQLTNASLPAAAANQDGRIIIDSTNGDLIFYKGGARYRLAGVGF